MGEWRHLDGSRAPVRDREPSVACLHASDLHGQLEPGHHVYYDVDGSPDFAFGDDGYALERGGGIPLLTAKLEAIRAAYDGTLALMSGDTFHGSAETTYTNGRAMLERDLGNCGFPFRDVRVADGVTPVDVVADYLEANSSVDYGDAELVRTADDGGCVQNTPADGPYPYVQPGVDAGGDRYCETRLVPGGNRFPEEGRNRYR